jgi:hypothetical protein
LAFDDTFEWSLYLPGGPKKAKLKINFEAKVWRGGKKTHASSPSTSGKTHEKTCPIQTRRETRASFKVSFFILN